MDDWTGGRLDGWTAGRTAGRIEGRKGQAERTEAPTGRVGVWKHGLSERKHRLSGRKHGLGPLIQVEKTRDAEDPEDAEEQEEIENEVLHLPCPACLKLPESAPETA